jgi:N-acetylneuraminate synthase
MIKNMEFASDLIQTDPWPIARNILIIAEIGINHNGSVEIAKELIDAAKNAGYGAVKFQKRTIDIVYSKEVLDSPRESPWGTTQREQKDGLEFGQEEYEEIDTYCKKVGIDWFASAWDVPSQKFLQQFNFKYNKISSPMLTHLDLVEVVAKEKKPTFVSTGMSEYKQIDEAVDIFKKHSCPIILMHTVSEYPAPEYLLNLRCIHVLRERYKVPIAYSGHETTMFPSVVAAILGAVAVERHITLDRAMYGSDQSASLERRGMEMMSSYINTLPTILGDGVKRISKGEMAVEEKLRYFINKSYGHKET